MALKTQGTLIEIEEPLASGTWVALFEITGGDLYDGEAAQIDTTHLQSTRLEFLMGLPDEGTVTLRGNFDPSQASHALLRARRNGQTLSKFRVTWTDPAPATVDTFEAFVLRVSASGDVNNKWNLTTTLRITDEVTTT